MVDQWHTDEPRPTVDRQLDLSPQAPGVYVIQVEADGKVHSRKVIRK